MKCLILTDDRYVLPNDINPWGKTCHLISYTLPCLTNARSRRICYTCLLPNYTILRETTWNVVDNNAGEVPRFPLNYFLFLQTMRPPVKLLNSKYESFEVNIKKELVKMTQDNCVIQMGGS